MKLNLRRQEKIKYMDWWNDLSESI